MNKDIRKKILQMVEVGFIEDGISRFYDFINMAAIILNLGASILFTFDSINGKYGDVLSSIEIITVFFFLIDYILRIITADLLYPGRSVPKAILKYTLSFTGIIDLLSFLPYFLPIFFPAGSVAFRMLRIVRIFRLFRINSYYDSLNVITSVLVSKGQQLISSVFIIVVLMIASSLCMYSLEHAAQPEVFSNAFSGIWWSASTLLTVGYGDIYPITTAGKALSIVITFLGVGMVAIPTGIISAGFVEQYSKIKETTELDNEKRLSFIKVHVHPGDPWNGKRIKEINLPADIIIAAILRKYETIVPNGDVVILDRDTLLLGAKAVRDDWSITLQEILLTPLHPWCNVLISDLDISRQTTIITVQRKDKTIIPNGSLRLQAEDSILLYTKKRIPEANQIKI